MTRIWSTSGCTIPRGLQTNHKLSVNPMHLSDICKISQLWQELWYSSSLISWQHSNHSSFQITCYTWKHYFDNWSISNIFTQTSPDFKVCTYYCHTASKPLHVANKTTQYFKTHFSFLNHSPSRTQADEPCDNNPVCHYYIHQLVKFGSQHVRVYGPQLKKMLISYKKTHRYNFVLNTQLLSSTICAPCGNSGSTS